MTIIHGYQPTDVVCPYCGDSHGALETTDVPGVVLYRCWCGATAKSTVDEEPT